jgi:hypothetical protein
MLWGTCWPNESRGWGQRLQRGGGASLSVLLNMRLARYGVAPLGPWNVSGARDGAGGARPSQPHSAQHAAGERGGSACVSASGVLQGASGLHLLQWSLSASLARLW